MVASKIHRMLVCPCIHIFWIVGNYNQFFRIHYAFQHGKEVEIKKRFFKKYIYIWTIRFVFFDIKLSYLRYQVIIFLHVVIMVYLGLCSFILQLRSRSYGTPISTYHFCNLKLTFLRYKLFHTSCVNSCQICHIFLFYHNILFFITTCMSFFITNIFWYIYYFFCYSMARKRT